jgi:ATP-dependent exoDNAse (exonuclease V) alpha subunit
MYRDLDPKTWPAGQSIAKHPLVRELFEGTKNPNITLAEQYDIDDPDLKKDIPHLIRDADSSQHRALVHALRGQNLVIEGPPGTGKSQTITNLMAAALARGKNSAIRFREARRPRTVATKPSACSRWPSDRRH